MRDFFLCYLSLYLNKSEHEKPWIKPPQQLYLLSKECGINPVLYSWSGGASVLSRILPLVCVKWRVLSKQQLILTKFNRPGNFKEVTGFKKKTELCSYKCRSKSATSSTFTFNGLSNSNVKVFTIF